MAAGKLNLTIEQGATFSQRVAYLRNAGEVTFVATAPGVVTWAGHGLSAGDTVYFTSSGLLPSALVTGTIYYISAIISSDAFNISAAPGGASIDFATAGAGPHTAFAPIDISGYSARMHCRTAKDTVDPPLLTLSTANGRISVTGAHGIIDLLVAAADTAAITWASAFYDMEIFSSDVTPLVIRIVEGRVSVSKEVTR